MESETPNHKNEKVNAKMAEKPTFVEKQCQKTATKFWLSIYQCLKQISCIKKGESRK